MKHILSVIIGIALISTTTNLAFASFDDLLNESGANRFQQDLDNERAFMDCLDTGKPADECWAWVLEDCTRLLTVEECEAIEGE